MLLTRKGLVSTLVVGLAAILPTDAHSAEYTALITSDTNDGDASCTVRSGTQFWSPTAPLKRTPSTSVPPPTHSRSLVLTTPPWQATWTSPRT